MTETTEELREQMDQTRSSLSVKLETLEQHVLGTMRGATAAVAEKMDSVTEAVQETVGTVKETIRETVTTVKDTFNMPRQFQQRPWVMLGGSLLLGYLAGTLLRRGRSANERSMAVADSEFDRPEPSSGSEPAAEQTRRPTVADKIVTALEPELARVKGLAIGYAMGVLRNAVTNAVHGELGEELVEMIDQANVRLGGEPLR